MSRIVLLLLTVLPLWSCLSSDAGVVEGLSLDSARPVLVMAVPDFEYEDGREAENTGSVASAAVRQAFKEMGFDALNSRYSVRSLALAEARELGCGMVAEGRVIDFNESHRDWRANPDRMGISLRVLSADDGTTLGWGQLIQEDETLDAARDSALKLAVPLASDVLLAILEGQLAASDVPGS